jgi:hypothetical protein
MKTFSLRAAAALLVIAAAAQPAIAGTETYRVLANDTDYIRLRVCGASALTVRGDGDTDLDFTVFNSSGAVVHQDDDLTDITFARLRPAGECEAFRLKVENLGPIFNIYTVTLD